MNNTNIDSSILPFDNEGQWPDPYMAVIRPERPPAPETTGFMKSHVGKLPGLSVRVALVLAVLDWSSSNGTMPLSSISKAHIGRACHYVGEHLRQHAFRAYGAASVVR